MLLLPIVAKSVRIRARVTCGEALLRAALTFADSNVSVAPGVRSWVALQGKCEYYLYWFLPIWFY
jgi:hypothetical protein